MKLFRRKPPEPTQMNVDLALFRGDELLCRGTINIATLRLVSKGPL
jgi:hypothetical protein